MEFTTLHINYKRESVKSKLRKRIYLTISGSSDRQISKLAILELSKFLECDESEVETICDIEIEIKGEDVSKDYVATVIAKIKK